MGAWKRTRLAGNRDDTIWNKLSLYPDLQWTLGRAFWGIDADYRVALSAGLMERAEGYSLKAFDRKQITVPAKQDYWPGQDNPARQWERWG